MWVSGAAVYPPQRRIKSHAAYFSGFGGTAGFTGIAG